MINRFRRLERWQRTLLIVFFAQLCSATGFSLIFPFLPLYIEELGSSTGLSVEVLSGLVIAAQAITMMIAAPIMLVGGVIMALREDVGLSWLVAVAVLMIFIAAGRLIGLMPHPEAYLHRTHHPRWTREADLPEDGMGLWLYKNAVNYIREQVI